MPSSGTFVRRSRPTIALTLLTLAYVVNFVDRQLVSIVGEPLKAELGLSDLQYGLLGGTGFAIFYTVLALPIARFSERRDRVRVIAVALAIWSGATALFGAAGGFAQLLAARMAVGVGEAGATPVSQSLVVDLVPAALRATALSLLSLGIPFGMLVAGTAGSALAQSFGWRAAFGVFGAAGLLLAVALAAILRDPRREAPSHGIRVAASPVLRVARRLIGSPVARHMAAGASLASFSGYGLTYFAVPLLVRVYQLPIAQAGNGFGVEAGIAIAVGIIGGGWLSDRLAVRCPDAPGTIAAAGAILAAVAFELALVQESVAGAAIVAFVPLAAAHLYFGPTYAVMVGAVAPEERATALALVIAAMTAIGLGLGPITVGWLSDRFADAELPGFAHVCGADLSNPLCAAASGTGLIGALAVTMLGYLWAATHFALAACALRGAAQPQRLAR